MIPGEVVDSLPGAYHDAVSGAYVSFHGHARGAFGSEPPEVMRRPPDGHVGGVPYFTEVIADVRGYLIERWKRQFGEEYQPDGETAASLPLEGADRFRVMFWGPTAQWTFLSDIYTAAQLERVRQLLFDRDVALCLGAPDYAAGGAHPKGTTESTYLSVREGDSAASVMERLGPPQLQQRSGRTGLQLSYVFERPDWWYWGHLHFDEQQRLVRRVEKLAP